MDKASIRVQKIIEIKRTAVVKQTFTIELNQQKKI